MPTTQDSVLSAGHRSYRIGSVDFLRGLVMIIMALDHTRDFFHVGSLTGDPLNLQTTTPWLFATRWITHICAPVFVFLSGTSIYLQGLRKSKKALSAFVVKRGLWLILVEVVLVTFAITFDVFFTLTILQVIWAIGISMILLGLMVRLPFKMILFIGALIVLGHNSLDFWQLSHEPPYPLWYALLHVQSLYKFGHHDLFILYPFLPWAGVMMLGYCFGSVFNFEAARRNRMILWIGIGLLTLFVLLRLTDTYGDPLHWSKQPTALFTFLSFINTQKYPPSLLYLCATISPALIVMACFGNASNRFIQIVTVYGKVPFLYYLCHFYLIHLLSAALYLYHGHTVEEGMTGVPGVPFKFLMPGEGYSLWIVYLVWISVVIVLYPVCKWFGTYKQLHRNKWLSYL